MTPDELADIVLAGERFRDQLRNIAVNSILADLPAITPASERPMVEWNHALFACSALTAANSESAQEAALRVAQGCLADPESAPTQRDAAAVLLERMGNRPALELAEVRELVEVDAWGRAPSPLQLDVIHSRLELTIPLAKGDAISVNPFQREFWNAACIYPWLSVSAPTSAGKSFVVKRWFEERLANSEQFRGVYLVPTRALIEEVSRDLRSDFSSQVGIYALPWEAEINTGPKEIYVLTQERLHLLQQRFPNLGTDVLFVDEAQKFGDGTRGVLLQRVLDEAVRRSPKGQVIFASPLTENPELLLEGAPAGVEVSALPSETITVNQNLLWANQIPRAPTRWKIERVAAGQPEVLGEVELSARPSPESKRLPFLAVAIGAGDPGNVVYVNGASSAEKTARQIYDALGAEHEIVKDPRIGALRELIEKTIHEDYALSTVLSRGVAFHYGNMPLIVRAEIERLFREGILRYLVCTSTLLEGVNLPCRNLFARGPKKGRGNVMSPADFWNLAGRAGRWGKEFQGNIICVDTANEKLWPEVPRSRARTPITRASDPVVEKPDLLRKYIEAGTPADESRAEPLMESVFSFLATRYAQGVPFAEVPGINLGDRTEQVEQTVGEALADVEIPVDTFAVHPGISPISMQRLLDYFRNKGDDTKLILATPESNDAADSYVSALGRSNELLGAKFGTGGRLWAVAMLVTHWMRGYPLARLIAERITYYEGRDGAVKLASLIRSTMDDVEQIARFEAPKYLACYLDVLTLHLGQTGKSELADEMPDLTMMLELGVSRQTELSLMALGLSRTTAVALSELITADDLDREGVLAWLSEQKLAELDLASLIKLEISTILADVGSDETA
ncbi:MAG TPA: DEAD/DEAH box helicase [Solirubrobacterales bacterium]